MIVWNFYFEAIEQVMADNGEILTLVTQKNIGSYINRELGYQNLRKQYVGLTVLCYPSDIVDYEWSE